MEKKDGFLQTNFSTRTHRAANGITPQIVLGNTTEMRKAFVFNDLKGGDASSAERTALCLISLLSGKIQGKDHFLSLVFCPKWLVHPTFLQFSGPIPVGITGNVFGGNRESNSVEQGLPE